MNARNQYLRVLQRKYLMAKSRKEKSLILDEYCKNTHQNRKYVIRKIRSSISLVPRGAFHLTPHNFPKKRYDTPILISEEGSIEMANRRISMRKNKRITSSV